MKTLSFGNAPTSRPIGSNNRPVMKQPGLLPQALNSAVWHGGDQVQFGGLRLFGTDNPAETPEPLSPMELFRQDREKEFSEISLHPRFQQSSEEREMMRTLFRQYTNSLDMEMMMDTLPDVYRKQLDNTIYVAQHLASHTRRHPQVLDAALEQDNMKSFMQNLLNTSISVAEALARHSDLREYRESDREAFTTQLMILFGAAVESSRAGIPQYTTRQLLREAATRFHQYDDDDVPNTTQMPYPEWSGANLPPFFRSIPLVHSTSGLREVDPLIRGAMGTSAVGQPPRFFSLVGELAPEERQPASARRGARSTRPSLRSETDFEPSHN